MQMQKKKPKICKNLKSKKELKHAKKHVTQKEKMPQMENMIIEKKKSKKNKSK